MIRLNPIIQDGDDDFFTRVPQSPGTLYVHVVAPTCSVVLLVASLLMRG